MLQTSFNNKYYHGKTEDNRYYVIIARYLVDAAFQRWLDGGGRQANSAIYTEAVSRYYSAEMWASWQVPPNTPHASYTRLDRFIIVTWTFNTTQRLYTFTSYNDGQVLTTVELKDIMTIENLLRHLRAKRIIELVSDPIGGVYVEV